MSKKYTTFFLISFLFLLLIAGSWSFFISPKGFFASSKKSVPERNIASWPIQNPLWPNLDPVTNRAILPHSPNVPVTLPTGSSLQIPPAILNQYLTSPQRFLYPSPLNFLIHNYAVAGENSAGEDTFYIPLEYQEYDSYYGGYKQGIEDRREAREERRQLRFGNENTAMISVDDVVASNASTDAGTVFRSVKNIELDLATLPDLPKLKTPEQLDLKKQGTSDYKVSCNSIDSQTEAGAACVNCNLMEKNSEVEGYLNDVEKLTSKYKKNKTYASVHKNFCKSCHGVDMGEFISYIEERAKQKQVPPEIMLAIMLRESNGSCSAKGDENGDVYSYGLFQLYTKNSTKLRQCNKRELKGMSSDQMKRVCNDPSKYKAGRSPQTNPRAPGVCLDNPYCNFEESINLLRHQKWPQENKGKPSGKSWTEMQAKERNLWRNAIIAYNGSYYMKKAEKGIKNQGLGEYIDDWEVKRMHFIRNYVRKSAGQRSKARSGSMHNLAYLERVTGRETRDGLSKSSICEWINFKSANKDLSCRK